MRNKVEIQKTIGAGVIKSAPKISIITPAYNSAEFIAETLESVFAQTFQDCEIIVSNDGSPDTKDFEAIIASFSDKIVYLKHENIGAGAARNTAIEHSRGEFIAFLDADDVWSPEFLASQIEFLEKSDFDMVYADALLFGKSLAKEKSYMKDSPSEGKADFDALLDLRCNVITSGTLVRKQSIIDAGMFEWEKVRAHDFVLWLKMAKNGARIGYQRDILLKHRIHPNNLSGNSIQQVEREIDVFQRIGKVIELDETQKNVVEKQLNRLESYLEVERGKIFLMQKNFISAKNAFRKANDYRRSLKLQLIICLTLFAPGLLLKLYKFCRPEEIEFISDVIKRV
jgi:teichuronic acid biosynthesis glycosyltransferase TuaG